MKLRCTIGSQGFVGSPTYIFGEVYELDDEDLAKKIVQRGYAEELSKASSSVVTSSLVEANKELTITSDIKKKGKPQRKK